MTRWAEDHKDINVLPPGFEPGFLDRKSKVLSNTFPYLLTGLDDRSLQKKLLGILIKVLKPL